MRQFSTNAARFYFSYGFAYYFGKARSVLRKTGLNMR